MSARKRPYLVGIVVIRQTPPTSLLLLELSTAVRGLAPRAYLYSSFAYLWCIYNEMSLMCDYRALSPTIWKGRISGKVRLLAMHFIPLCLC